MQKRRPQIRLTKIASSNHSSLGPRYRGKERMFAAARKFQALPGIAIWAIFFADHDSSLGVVR
jgi:hypothetical protein